MEKSSEKSPVANALCQLRELHCNELQQHGLDQEVTMAGEENELNSHLSISSISSR